MAPTSARALCASPDVELDLVTVNPGSDSLSFVPNFLDGGVARSIDSGGSEPVAKKRAIERRVGRPGVEADADLAAAIVEAAGHEVAGVRLQLDDIAIGRCALDPGDGAGIDPRMASVKGPGAARLQHDSGCVHGPPRSTASM